MRGRVTCKVYAHVQWNRRPPAVIFVRVGRSIAQICPTEAFLPRGSAQPLPDPSIPQASNLFLPLLTRRQRECRSFLRLRPTERRGGAAQLRPNQCFDVMTASPGAVKGLRPSCVLQAS
jgi:hypothetical protein